MNGASASRARRRAISVLPTPVGPIIRMFLGVISCRRGSATCWRRQRFLRAIATARFSRGWATRGPPPRRAPPAFFGGGRHGALCADLADDVLVQLVDDFLGSHGRHGGG